jgi:hypothetical protein
MTLRCLATRQQPFADFLVGTALSSYFSDGRFAAAVGYDNLTDFAAAVGHDKCNRLFLFPLCRARSELLLTGQYLSLSPSVSVLQHDYLVANGYKAQTTPILWVRSP